MSDNKIKTLSLTLLLAGLSAGAYATVDDAIIDDTVGDSVVEAKQVNINQMNVDGTWQDKVKAEEKSNEEIIEQARQDADRNNTKMIAEKIVKQKIPEKQKKVILKKEAGSLEGRVSELFDDGSGDAVKTGQAAPSNEVIATAPIVVTEDKMNKKLKVTPQFGLLKISSENIDFESSMSAGVAVESMVNERFAFGLGFNYATLDIKDMTTDYSTGIYNNYSPYYNSTWYNNNFGQGRTLNYKHLNLDIVGKVYLTVESSIRPYVGAGLGLNRSTLKYEDTGRQSYQYYNTQATYGNEEYSSTYASGIALLGTEVNFSDTVGLNLEFKFAKGLTSGTSQTAGADSQYNPDQKRLEDISAEMESASFSTINLGLNIKF
jgi:outer membrane protein W